MLLLWCLKYCVVVQAMRACPPRVRIQTMAMMLMMMRVHSLYLLFFFSSHTLRFAAISGVNLRNKVRLQLSLLQEINRVISTIELTVRKHTNHDSNAQQQTDQNQSNRTIKRKGDTTTTTKKLYTTNLQTFCALYFYSHPCGSSRAQIH